MSVFRISSAFAVVALMLAAAGAASAETLRVYGPGGPAPAMKELAAAFGASTGHAVEITAGPTGNWLAKAKLDADVVFSGSENMMLGFITAFEDQIDRKSVEPLYLRPSAILVRKGNPKGIKGVRDLTRPGIGILVTEGAGQVGMWEDVAGRTGELKLIKEFRANILEFAANSGLALQSWKQKPEIDAWLIWNHWQIANSDIADLVTIEPELTIWRSTDAALTKRGAQNPASAAFVAYLKSAAGEATFKKWGWRR